MEERQRKMTPKRHSLPDPAVTPAIAHPLRPPRRINARQLAGPDAVTPEERRMMELIITDHRDEAIAAELNIGVRTMQRHLRALMDRVGAPNRGALCALATFHGWIDIIQILMIDV